MKLLAHPILCGLGVEASLIGTFLLFPVGSCNAPLPGIAVLYLHQPGFLFSEHVLRFTSDRQHLVVAPIVMAEFGFPFSRLRVTSSEPEPDTEMDMTTPPNHALQRTRPSRPRCNRAPSWAGSLSLGR